MASKDGRKYCAKCKRQFLPQKGTRRSYCYTCRPASQGRDLGEAEVIALPATTTDFSARVRTELTAAGLDGSSAAMLLMMIAQRLEAAQSAYDFTALYKAFSEQSAVVFGKQAPDSAGALVVEAIFRDIG